MFNYLRELIYDMFCRNFWGFFHCLAGGLGAKFLCLWTNFSAGLIVFIITLSAFLYEVYQFCYKNKGDLMIVGRKYGTIRRWRRDSLGDIVLAVLCSIIVVIGI